MAVDLRDLARAAGFDPEYTSWRGERVASSEETLRMALATIAPHLGVDIERDDAIRAIENERWKEMVPPVVLAWDGRLALPFHVPAEFDDDWECEVTLEDGGTVRAHGRLFDLPAEGHAWPGGVVHCRRTASVWLEGQLGYHSVTWKTAGGEGEALVIAAPSKAAGQPGYGMKRWGVFAPVYGLASRESGAAGDLRTLRMLMEQVGKRGGKYVATLPILAAFLDEPYAFSPYSPASRLFWNELYLDLHAIAAEIGVAVPAPPPIAVNEPIDYRAQYRWRRPVIDQVAQRLIRDPAFVQGIDEWARETGAYDYAAFRAIGERERSGWHSWPVAVRDGGAGIATSRERAWELAGGGEREKASVDTHLVAQWLMQSQLEQMHGGDAQLYLDLPVGVNCDAYEVWRFRKLFLLDLAAGAPPDALFLGGQNWGLPPLSPHALRRDRYRYFIRCLRHHMRTAGMLRIDHVMGLFRLYCVPSGRPATDGVYLRYPYEELIAIVTLESRRSHCAVTGEDLGTVPENVRPTMTRHGLFRLHVGQWSFPSEPGKSPEASPAEAVASLNTHDTATFAGWWRGLDIDDQRDLGLINAEQEAQQRAEREKQKLAILAFAGPNAAEDTLTEVERMMVAVTTDLALGPAEIVLATIDDLVLDPVPHNVPGTVSERPNWQRRLQNWSQVLDPERAPPAAAAAVTALIAARPSS
ncbi:MAG TPA: 4-alpha-glucanotransferase [Kofleriaceae bacterium]|nr:4-alpha-glucanotransferase [Kofleriaceae bacterium]